MTGKANGDAYSRTEYNELFSRIGTTYGEGDGSTTFNVPNLMDKFIEGGYSNQIGTTVNAGLPNITGNIAFNHFTNNTKVPQGGYKSLYLENRDTNLSWAIAYNDKLSGIDQCFINIDASRSSAIYGNSNTVQPPAIKMYPVIVSKSNSYVAYCFRRTA